MNGGRTGSREGRRDRNQAPSPPPPHVFSVISRLFSSSIPFGILHLVIFPFLSSSQLTSHLFCTPLLCFSSSVVFFFFNLPVLLLFYSHIPPSRLPCLLSPYIFLHPSSFVPSALRSLHHRALPSSAPPTPPSPPVCHFPLPLSLITPSIPPRSPLPGRNRWLASAGATWLASCPKQRERGREGGREGGRRGREIVAHVSALAWGLYRVTDGRRRSRRKWKRRMGGEVRPKAVIFYTEGEKESSRCFGLKDSCRRTHALEDKSHRDISVPIPA